MARKGGGEVKVKFTLSIGLLQCEKKTTIDLKSLGYTVKEWKELSEDEKWREADAWAQNHVEIGYEEIPEDGDDEGDE